MTKTISLFQRQSKFFLYLFSDIIPFIVNLINFSLLLRKANQNMYGEYVFIISLSTWFFSLIIFGMNYTGVNLIRENQGSLYFTIKTIITLRLILLMAPFLVLLLLYLFSVIRLTVFILFLLFCFLQVFQIDFVNIALENPNNNSISRLSQGLIMLVGILFFINKKSSVEELLIIQISSLFIGLSIMFILLRNTIKTSKSIRNNLSTIKIFRSGFSVSLAQFCQAGYLNMDVIILGLLSKNTIIVGQYGAYARLLLTGLIPMTSLLNSFGAKISTAFLNRDKRKLIFEIREMQKISNILGILGFLVMFFFSRFAIEIFSGAKSDINPTIIIIFSVVYVFYALQLPFFATLPYLQKSKEFFKISSIALLISLVVSFAGYHLFSSMFVALGVLAYAIYLAYSSKNVYNSFLRNYE